ncbi:MAG: hypothetical protein ACD_4C00144G0001 [uncultured bacterium (gcode 4)]|uniref:N-acetyltransferase domain-containing protein n=1 Tax=uncultured bacterium (gcode 4) TaxID=1234023 RepID=K2GTU3_9BACT|nr:MAG: hypothetical protein ACD_4C00144G0001 [uncultured bacterium (gcode 4)]
MNIRYYKDSDYEEIKNILQSWGHFDEVWDSRSHWKAKIEKDPTSILVAESDNEVVGCQLIIKDEWTCFLFRLAIKENFRNQGIWSMLMKKAEDQLRDESVDEVAFFVNDEDLKLQEYYERRDYIKGWKYRCMYKKL